MDHHLFFFFVGRETSCPIIGEDVRWSLSIWQEAFFLLLDKKNIFIVTQIYFVKLWCISSNKLTCFLSIEKGNQVLPYRTAQDTSDNCWK